MERPEEEQGSGQERVFKVSFGYIKFVVMIRHANGEKAVGV